MGFLANLLALIVLLYFVPSLIALIRLHKDFFAIFLVNMLLGWTFVGWLLALLWAVFGGRDLSYAGRQKINAAEGGNDSIAELKREFAKGNISEEEYFRRKRILEESK